MGVDGGVELGSEVDVRRGKRIFLTGVGTGTGSALGTERLFEAFVLEGSGLEREQRLSIGEVHQEVLQLLLASLRLSSLLHIAYLRFRRTGIEGYEARWAIYSLRNVVRGIVLLEVESRVILLDASSGLRLLFD